MGCGCNSQPKQPAPQQGTPRKVLPTISTNVSYLQDFPKKEPIFCHNLKFDGKQRFCLNGNLWPGIVPLQISLSACRSCPVGMANPHFEKRIVRTVNSVEIISPVEPLIVKSDSPVIDVVSSKLSSVNLFREALSVWPDSDPDKIFVVMQDMKIRYFEKSGTPLCEDCLAKVRIFREMAISRGYVKRKVFVSGKDDVNLDLCGFDWIIVGSEPDTSSVFFGIATHIVSSEIPPGVIVRDFLDRKLRTSIVVVDNLETLIDRGLMDVVMS
jgi:hypothetical protein